MLRKEILPRLHLFLSDGQSQNIIRMNNKVAKEFGVAKRVTVPAEMFGGVSVSKDIGRLCFCFRFSLCLPFGRGQEEE